MEENKIFKTYSGGKEGNGVYQYIINKIRPHDVYLEAMAGNYTIARKINNDAIKIANEIDLEIFNRYPQNGTISFSNLDYREFISINVEKFKGKKIVIFLDPPYLFETRKNKRNIYKYEWETYDHIQMLDFVVEIKKNNPTIDILLTHPPHHLYKSKLADWFMGTFDNYDRHTKTIDCLYTTYDQDNLIELQDYSYLGTTYTKRQNIKRSILNITKKIDNLPPLHKAYLKKILATKEFQSDDY